MDVQAKGRAHGQPAHVSSLCASGLGYQIRLPDHLRVLNAASVRWYQGCPTMIRDVFIQWIYGFRRLCSRDHIRPLIATCRRGASSMRHYGWIVAIRGASGRPSPTFVRRAMLRCGSAYQIQRLSGDRCSSQNDPCVGRLSWTWAGWILGLVATTA